MHLCSYAFVLNWGISAYSPQARYSSLAAALDMPGVSADRRTALQYISFAQILAYVEPIVQYLQLQGCTLTGRAIARILHGVASPAFPTAQWSKCGFWQQYTNIDFAQVLVLGEHEANVRRQNKEAAGDVFD